MFTIGLDDKFFDLRLLPRSTLSECMAPPVLALPNISISTHICGLGRLGSLFPAAQWIASTLLLVRADHSSNSMGSSIDADLQVLSARLTALLVDILQDQLTLSMSFGPMLPVLSSPLLYLRSMSPAPVPVSPTRENTSAIVNSNRSM